MCRFVESSISYAETIMKISLQGNKVFGFRAPKNFNSHFTFFGFKLNSFWHCFDSMLNQHSRCDPSTDAERVEEGCYCLLFHGDNIGTTICTKLLAALKCIAIDS